MVGIETGAMVGMEAEAIGRNQSQRFRLLIQDRLNRRSLVFLLADRPVGHPDVAHCNKRARLTNPLRQASRKNVGAHYNNRSEVAKKPYGRPEAGSDRHRDAHDAASTGADRMALHYQTECRLGTRRINRSYSGYQAFVAILFDLIFGLLFELVATAFSLAFRLISLSVRLAVQVLKSSWRVLVAAMAALVFTLTLPFVILHRAIAQLAPAGRSWPRERSRDRPRNPTGRMGREV